MPCIGQALLGIDYFWLSNLWLKLDYNTYKVKALRKYVYTQQLYHLTTQIRAPYLVGALWGSHDGRLPVEKVVADGAGRALRGWVAAQILQFLKHK